LEQDAGGNFLVPTDAAPKMIEYNCLFNSKENSWFSDEFNDLVDAIDKAQSAGKDPWDADGAAVFKIEKRPVEGKTWQKFYHEYVDGKVVPLPHNWEETLKSHQTFEESFMRLSNDDLTLISKLVAELAEIKDVNSDAYNTTYNKLFTVKDESFVRILQGIERKETGRVLGVESDEGVTPQINTSGTAADRKPASFDLGSTAAVATPESIEVKRDASPQTVNSQVEKIRQRMREKKNADS